MTPHGILDATCPIEWAHPLNSRLSGEWTIPPLAGWRGGLTFRDLVRGGRRTHDGTLTNGPTWAGPQGLAGGFGSLNFDGTNYVDVGGGTDFNVTTGNFTVACWVRWTTTDAAFALAKTQGSGTNGYDILLSGGFASLRLNGGASSLTSSAGVNDGKWHHLVGARHDGEFNFFVDGISTGTTLSGMDLGDTAAPLQFGGRNGTAFAGFAGSGWQIWPTRGMTATDVAALYAESRRGNPDRWRWVRGRSWVIPVAANTFTASASLTVGAAMASGSATFSPGTKTATAALTVGATTAAGSATFTAPVYTGSASLTAGAATLAASGTFAAPVYTASAAVTVGATTLAGSAIFATEVYSGTAALTVGAATLSASATFTPPTYAGTATLTIGAATASGSATFTAPVYTGTAALTAGAATFSGTAAFDESLSTGTATLTVGAVVCAGVATFTASAEPAGPAAILWVSDGAARTWQGDAGRRTWQSEGGNAVGKVRNTIEEEAGLSAVTLGIDFGDVPEVRDGSTVTAIAVSVEAVDGSTPGNVTVAGAAVDAAGYRCSARFTCSVAAEYDIVWTATLDTTPASQVVRTGRLKLV